MLLFISSFHISHSSCFACCPKTSETTTVTTITTFIPDTTITTITPVIWEELPDLFEGTPDIHITYFIRGFQYIECAFPFLQLQVLLYDNLENKILIFVLL